MVGQMPCRFVAANSEFPTIGCPPFSDKSDMLVNIHSTLQMPSQTPVLTVMIQEIVHYC